MRRLDLMLVTLIGSWLCTSTAGHAQQRSRPALADASAAAIRGFREGGLSTAWSCAVSGGGLQAAAAVLPGAGSLEGWGRARASGVGCVDLQRTVLRSSGSCLCQTGGGFNAARLTNRTTKGVCEGRIGLDNAVTLNPPIFNGRFFESKVPISCGDKIELQFTGPGRCVTHSFSAPFLRAGMGATLQDLLLR